MILIVQELAAFTRCSVCEQLKAEKRFSAHRYLPPQCFSTISAGSQIQCLGLGAWAEQTAHALGAQTESTTRSQTSGSRIWMRLGIIALEFLDLS